MVTCRHDYVTVTDDVVGDSRIGVAYVVACTNPGCGAQVAVATRAVLEALPRASSPSAFRRALRATAEARARAHWRAERRGPA